MTTSEMSPNQFLSTKSRLFERLQQLDDIFSSREISTHTVKFVKRDFNFLDVFLTLQRFTNEPNMVDVTQKVQALFEDALVDFSKLHLAEYFDVYTSKVQNMISLTKMEIKAKYSTKITSLPLSAKNYGIGFNKFVTEFIDTVIKNLHDLVKIDYPGSLLYAPETMEHLEDVLKELKMLQNFVCFVSQRCIEPQSQHVIFFTHVLAVTSHASMLCWLYLPELAPEEINYLLSAFLQMRIQPIQPCLRKIYVDVLQSLKSTTQARWYPSIQNEHAVDTQARFVETIFHDLMNLLTNNNSNQKVALKDQLANLQEMLNILRAKIIHVPIQDLEPLLKDIDTVIIDVGLLVYSLCNSEEEEQEDMLPGEVNLAQVLDLVSTVIYHTTRKEFQSNLPMIHGLGYVDFFLNNLKEVKSRHSASLTSFTNQLQIIQKELESLQPFLKVVSQEQDNDLDKIHRCATQLIGKAYEVEYIVDACISKELHLWILERWLLDIMEEIALIKAEVPEIQEYKIVEETLSIGTTQTSSNFSMSPMINEEFVGFEDVIEKLRGQLTKGNKGRDVISIVGMPGLGKTTLAYKLYYDRSVVLHFDVRSHCCASQVYSRKELLLAILQNAKGENFECGHNRADELANKLRKALFSKRYLILVDDVWEARAWDDLIGCFPDANNGSRIILTTRNLEVANHARFQSEPLLLRMFNDYESWELLRQKVFGEKSCSPLLMNIGKQIAKKCGQLPLSVVLMAGILAEIEKKEECWEQMANNLRPHIHKDTTAIIEQSYQRLPYHLRSCFLYFGTFLEDSVIDVTKLTRKWISEGFVKSCEGKSLEDIAEGYLENLFGRNLVMGTKTSSGGKIKGCYIHDVLHDFCKERANEENLWINGDQYSKPSHNKQIAHRMSIYGEGHRFGEWSSCWSYVGSIISHDRLELYRLVSHIFHNFKFLKVLDLEYTTIDSFPTNLVYLRYFAAQTSRSSISAFIARSWNLETLILHNYRKNMSLPVTLYEMVKLRHLHISNCSFTAEELLESSKKLSELRTLSYPCFSSVQDAELILRGTPNLRELRCVVEGGNNFQYYVLKFPTRIETLKIYLKYQSLYNTIPFSISAPNLKYLKLSGFYLHPEDLSAVALLQNLQVLKLQKIEFANLDWKVNTGEFPQLKFLKLEMVDLQEWTVCDDAFNSLERLVLRRCYDLKEIPSCFGDVCSLKSIEAEDCPTSIEDSAMNIYEVQVGDYQNSDFKILVDGFDPEDIRSPLRDYAKSS